MDWDEARAKAAAGIAVGDNLDTLAVAELEVRISALQGEIDRVKAEVERKRAHEAAAAALFSG